MCGLLLSADMESCCPSAWSCSSAYMEYEVSAVKIRDSPRARGSRCTIAHANEVTT